ncbi:MAG: sigma-70 family RNA polymerase sigma factor [Polyangiaceae bacterium]
MSPELAQLSAKTSVAELFKELAPFVWRALKRLGVADRDVDDQVQEVFVVIHRKLAEFEGRSSIRTWVYGICVRTASDYRNRARVKREMLPDEMPEQLSTNDAHEALAKHQARALLDRVLDDLDEDKRAVFVLYEIEELSMNDVAEAVSCPVQTAYSRLHAARKQVQDGIAALRRQSQPPSVPMQGGAA